MELDEGKDSCVCRGNRGLFGCGDVKIMLNY